MAQVDTFGELRFAGLLNRLWVKEDSKKLFIQLRDMYDRPISADAKWDEISQKMKWSYHKRLHAIDCSNELYQIKHLLNNPDAVECALLFHDAIYDPTSKTNEEDSATLAEKMLTQRWIQKDFIERVKQLILVTKHIKDSENNDEKYIMDIDKAILGKSPRIYNQYAKDVRREYYMYSDEQFKKWRGEFLTNEMHKDTVYHTEYFHQKYNAQAKENMTNELIISS